MQDSLIEILATEYYYWETTTYILLSTYTGGMKFSKNSKPLIANNLSALSNYEYLLM